MAAAVPQGPADRDGPVPRWHHGKSFYQKDAPSFAPPWLRTVRIWSEGTSREIDYFVCDDVESLLYVANLGRSRSTSGRAASSRSKPPTGRSSTSTPRRPVSGRRRRRPGDPRPLRGDRDAGLHQDERSDGPSRPPAHGRPMHVHGVAHPGRDPRQGGRAALRRSPRPVRSVGARGGRVYIDFLQNVHGQTIAGPFSARPVPGAQASAPLKWSEVNAKLDVWEVHHQDAAGPDEAPWGRPARSRPDPEARSCANTVPPHRATEGLTPLPPGEGRGEGWLSPNQLMRVRRLSPHPGPLPAGNVLPRSSRNRRRLRARAAVFVLEEDERLVPRLPRDLLRPVGERLLVVVLATQAQVPPPGRGVKRRRRAPRPRRCRAQPLALSASKTSSVEPGLVAELEGGARGRRQQRPGSPRGAAGPSSDSAEAGRGRAPAGRPASRPRRRSTPRVAPRLQAQPVRDLLRGLQDEAKPVRNLLGPRASKEASASGRTCC